MPAVRVPAAVLARAQESTQTIAARTSVYLDAAELIGGRSALLGLPAPGRMSAGGATRLMEGSSGWCALTLSRPDDLDAVPALIGVDALPDPLWPAIEGFVRAVGVTEFAARARLLGLPVGVLGESRGATPVLIHELGHRAPAPRPRELLVVDLSSMWAGPLCGRVLADAGATVVKVESAARPDGTRGGPPAFFDWTNAGKLSYEADFDNPGKLRRLLTAADVVIEASRPAALQRRGLGPAQVSGRPGRVWARITGHGIDGDRGQWVAFGDDAAVAGGLVDAGADGPQFCADALADPLTGIEAARAVLESLGRGGGELLDVSMAGVAADYAGDTALPGDEKGCGTVLSVPTAAAELGAHNDVVERLVAARLGVPC